MSDYKPDPAVEAEYNRLFLSEEEREFAKLFHSEYQQRPPLQRIAIALERIANALD